jgi:hypothetical protein
VARAKLTARAEARRRYRAANRIVEPADDELETTDDPVEELARPAAPRLGRGPAPSKSAAPKAAAPARPGILTSLQRAYHRPNVREDVALLPRTLRHWSFLGGVAAIVIATAALLAFPGYSGSMFAWQTLVWPGSAVVTPMLVGFFAPRSSYILGFLIGLLQAVAYAISLPVLIALGGSTVDAGLVNQAIGLSFFSGSMAGLAFASAAAWYRRFLAMSSPKRPAGQRSGGNRGRSSNKSAARR